MFIKHATSIALLWIIAVPANAAEPKPEVIAPPTAAEQENEVDILIAQALDQKTTIEFKEVPIREAVKQLSDKTGVPIEVATGTVRFLPYGSQTLVTATIQDRTLRDALTAILQPIGLNYAAEKNRLMIRPAPALERLARRATWPELEQLQMLLAKPWSEELFATLKFQFQDSNNVDLSANLDTLRKIAGGVGTGTAAEVLEHATDRYGWTWYAAEDAIVILSKPRQIERQLERHVTLRYAQAGLKEVLLDLAGQAGVFLRMDPGVLSSIPAGLDRITLSVDNTTVRQALELLAGQTGLGYFIEPDGIRITTGTLNPTGSSAQVEATAQATVTALRSNSIVGQVTIPNKDGTSFSFFMREADLPPEVNELRKAKIQEAINQMHQLLSTTTQPKD